MVELGLCMGIGAMEKPWHLDSRMPVRLSDHQLVPSAMREQNAKLLKCVGKEKPILQVFVSAVVDPGQFYVHHHSEDHLKLHSRMVDEFSPKFLKADNVVVGELYSVQDQISKQWFRGKCIKKSGRTPVTNRAIYDFFLIDDGSTIKVAASTVRVIDDSLKKYTPMIWECSLELKKPENGWNKATVGLLKNHVLHKKFHMSVISICDEIRTVDLHPISDEPNEKLPSITETMQAALAEGKDEEVHVPASKIEKFIVREDHIMKGTPLSGKVASVNSPDDFFVRFDEADAFWSFNALLQQEYDQCHTWNSFKIVTAEKGII